MQKILIDSGSSGPNGAHSTESGLRCQRMKALEHLRRGEEDEALADGETVGKGNDSPLVRGSIGHVGLAHHYARRWAKETGEDPENFYEPIVAATMTAQKLHASAALTTKVLDALQDYFEFWKHEKLDVVDVEQLLVGPIAVKPLWLMQAFRSVLGDKPLPALVHTQRADLVVRERNGRIYIYDHKLVGNHTRDTVERYKVSLQFIGYQWLGRLMWGSEFAGTKVNFIEMGKDKPRFIREELPVAPHALSTFETTVAWERFQRLVMDGVAPIDRPGAYSEQTCVTQYGSCPLMDVCTWGESRLVTIGIKNTAAATLRGHALTK